MTPRRRFIAAGIGALAGAAGIAAALRQSRTSAPSEALWKWRPQRIDGSEFEFAGLRGKPLLLNFWATWCAPCVVEMPLLARFDRQYRAAGWQVVGVAVDQPEPVRAFITERGIGFPIVLAGGAGLELSRALGNRTGGLPFSVAFGADGAIKARKLGVLDERILSEWAAAP